MSLFERLPAVLLKLAGGVTMPMVGTCDHAYILPNFKGTFASPETEQTKVRCGPVSIQSPPL